MPQLQHMYQDEAETESEHFIPSAKIKAIYPNKTSKKNIFNKICFNIADK